VLDKRDDPALVTEVVLLRVSLVLDLDADAGVEEGQLAEPLGQDVEGKIKEIGNETKVQLGPARFDDFIQGWESAWITDPDGNIVEISKGYKDVDTAIAYENQLEKIKPSIKEENDAVQLGLFKDSEDPDLVLIFCTPGAADILNRSYTHVTGEPIQGFGGNGACPFAIQYPYGTKKPSFTYSDVAWRKYVGLADEELTVTFPYQSLVELIEYFPTVADEYKHYGEMVDE